MSSTDGSSAVPIFVNQQGQQGNFKVRLEGSTVFLNERPMSLGRSEACG